MKTNQYFFFWLHRAACGILIPQPGIEPAHSAVEVCNLNHQGSPPLYSQKINLLSKWMIWVNLPLLWLRLCLRSLIYLWFIPWSIGSLKISLVVRNGSESSNDLRERRKPQVRQPRSYDVGCYGALKKSYIVSECVDGVMSQNFRTFPGVRLPLFWEGYSAWGVKTKIILVLLWVSLV